MQPTRRHRLLLVLCGAIATAIGAVILFDPTGFHAAGGLALVPDPNLLSEVRAPGGALFALGLVMIAGAVARTLTATATIVAAAVYLAYGLSRLLGLALDGRPSDALLAATAVELVLGLACALAAWRTGRTTQPRPRFAPTVEEVA